MCRRVRIKTNLPGKSTFHVRPIGKATVQLRRSVTLALLLAMQLWGCAPLSYEFLPTIRPDPYYDNLYPYYIEIAALSQIRAKFASHGTRAGHAVMYLKGVCRVSDAPFPTIKVCESESINLNDPESGVGISVNKIFRNVNWMVVPGKKLFFYGNLEGDEVLNDAHVRETIRMAIEQGLFRGIQVHDQYLPSESEPEAVLNLLAKETLGTDFALNYGRTIFCVRLPVTREMLEKIVDYLNALNREYALGKADYNWSGYHDNCSHTLHNALAAALVWPFKSVQSFKIRQFFNLSIPANEFADLAILANTFPLESFNRIYWNKIKRKSLLEHDWLPARPGALVKLISVHQNNELYDTQVRIFMLQNPLLKPKSRKVDQFYAEPRYTDTKENLIYFKERYEDILKKEPAPREDTVGHSEYEKTRRAYYRYVRRELEDVHTKLRLFEQMQGLEDSSRPIF